MRYQVLPCVTHRSTLAAMTSTEEKPLCYNWGHQPDIEQTVGRDGLPGGWLDPDAYPLQSKCVYCNKPIMVVKLQASYWTLLPPNGQLKA